MNLDQLMALPQAGAAALAVHRWLATQPAPAEVNAFDLLACLVNFRQWAPDEIGSTLAAITAGDDRAAAMLLVLRAALLLERQEAVAKALGVRLTIPDEVAAEFQRLRQEQRKPEGDPQ